MQKVSVVIPCYNEEKTIEKVIKNIPKEIFEIIVVDNNSKDKSAEIAKKAGAKLVRETKQGYGAALKKGIKKAQGEIIVTLDADGQYPGEKILELVDYFEKNNLDFLNCARFPLKDKSTLPFLRRLGNYFFNIFFFLFFNIKTKDSQSGMMIFKKEILEKINLESDDMSLSEELKIKTILSDYKYDEINIDYYQREGKSKLIPWKHGLKNLFFLFKLKSQYTSKNFFIFLSLSLLLLFYLFLASANLNKPFINVTSDTNGENGLAVLNLLNIGVFDLKFGKYVGGYLNKENFDFEEARKNHEFYTNHPMFYLYPTYFLYKIFGVSETTTRGGPFLMFVLGIIFFYLALLKIFKNFILPFITTLVFIILPGTIYYGTTFELAVFSLPMALITFSLFVFYFYEKRNIYFYLLMASVFLGGLMGWFYFFMPASIWFYLLFEKNPEFKNQRRKLLIFLPLISILVFLLNLFHIYLLNGEAGFKSLKDAFLNRTQRLPLQFWLKDIYGRMTLNFNPLFLWLALLGILTYFVSYFKEFKILLPLILMPIFNTLVFYQWSTHPFGVIFFLPAVSLGIIFLFLVFQKKLKLSGILISIGFLIFGFYLSYQKIDFFINKFLILEKKDIAALEEIKNQVKDNEVCLGQNQMGLYYGGIVMWHLRKNILFSPQCLENQNIKLTIVFNPQLGEFYQNEALGFTNKGFKPLGCSGLWCYLVKE